MIFLGRAVQFGLSANRVRWPRSVGPELAERLGGCPVRVYRDAHALRHPADGEHLDVRGVVGHVQRGVVTADGVEALVEVVDPRVSEALLALERDGLLARVGLSLKADVLCRSAVEMGSVVRRVLEVLGVVALDCVSRPSAGGRLLRSIP